MQNVLSRLLRRRAMLSDGVLDLALSAEDPTDPENGITDGYTFRILPHGTKHYAGYVSLRIGESGALYYLGHIGYRVSDEYRGHGYAARACEILKPFIRGLGIKSLVITTDVDNLPSRATCERLGCVLERVADVPPEYRALCMGSAQKCRYIWRMSGGETTYA